MMPPPLTTWGTEELPTKMALKPHVRSGPRCTHFEAARARARVACTHSPPALQRRHAVGGRGALDLRKVL